MAINDIRARVRQDNYNEFRDFLRFQSKNKTIRLFYDIETFNYNCEAGQARPSEYRTGVYSVAVGIWDSSIIDETEETLWIFLYPSFRGLIDDILLAFKNIKNCPTIILNAHNGNGFDHHFLRRSLIDDYRLEVYNRYSSRAIEGGNIKALSVRELDTQQDKGILESRVKSRVNLEMDIKLRPGLWLKTEDNLLKTNSSLDLLGKKLKTAKKIDNEDMKQDLDYSAFNIDKDLSNEELKEYSLECFNNLDEKQLRYIINDIIVLAFCYKYYSVIFKEFNYNKITFTSNVLERYKINNLSTWQLLGEITVNKKLLKVENTKYVFRGINFYEYIRRAYRGGLNLYNQDYLNKIVERSIVALDINSSYPHVMHSKRVPTYIDSWQDYGAPTRVKVPLGADTFSIIEMTRRDFDTQIIGNIDSKMIRRALVKYYNNQHETVYITCTTLKLANLFKRRERNNLNIISMVTYKTKPFGARKVLAHYYMVKEQGKKPHKLIYNSPYDIKESEELLPAEQHFTSEEVDQAKVYLNSIYGVPALRSHFNLFRYDGANYYNVINGHKNSERQNIFSVYVTSWALYNLLSPLARVPAEKLDTGFYYCDTDSLYLDKDLLNYMDPNLLDDMFLGKWCFDADNITKLYIMNHKKIAYECEDGAVQIRAAGVPKSTFEKLEQKEFETFITEDFSPGSSLPATRAIFNKDETISIYEAQIELDQGTNYLERLDDKNLVKTVNLMFDDCREKLKDDHLADGLFISSDIGDFSLTEVFPPDYPSDDLLTLTDLKHQHEKVKKMIEQL